MIPELSAVIAGINWPSRYNLDPFDWSAFSAVVALVGLVLNLILLFTVYFGFLNVRDSTRTQVSNLLIWAASQMDGIKDDIKLVKKYRNQSGPWPEEFNRAAARVSAVYQRLAYMVRNDLIKAVHFKKMWGLSFVSLWRDLEPWIKDLRVQNGEAAEIADGAFSRIDFELLAQEYEAEFRHMVDKMNAAENENTHCES